MTDYELLNQWRNAGVEVGRKVGVVTERYRIIELLLELNVVRRDALGHLVAFNTDGTEVVYLTGLENK